MIEKIKKYLRKREIFVYRTIPITHKLRGKLHRLYKNVCWFNVDVVVEVFCVVTRFEYVAYETSAPIGCDIYAAETTM